MKTIEKYTKSLYSIFSDAPNKHEANYRSHEVLLEMSADKEFLTEALKQHLLKNGSLNTLHYPVVGLDIELNPYYGLVANCWIPLPDRQTNMSSKSIHHHGEMLLTTVTAFGTGYEHWTFETPAVVDAKEELYNLKLIEHAAHPVNHIAFVDAYVAHLPLYPPDCTVTYALWSSRQQTSWKDRLKRVPLLQENSERLRRLGSKLGLREALDLKVVEYFDYYPCAEGFRGMRERKEFERSNNEDYLYSLFFVLQKTGNDALASVIRTKLESSETIDNRELVSSLLKDLESGRDIEGRISDNHFGFEYANFTREQILDALNAQAARN